MWYGRLATRSHGARVDQSVDRRVQRRRLDEAQRPRPVAASNASRRWAASRRSTSTAVTSAPAAQQRAGQDAEARPDLQDAPAGRGCAPRRRSSRAPAVHQVVLASDSWRAQPVLAQVARDALGAEVARVELVRSGRVTGLRSDGQLERRLRVEVACRPRAPARARKKPAAPIIAALSVHRPGRGTTSGMPQRRAHRPRCARAARELAATPPPRTIVRAPMRFGARAASWSSARRRPTPGTP